MTPNEMKRLRRTDLLEMLIESGKQVEDLAARLAEAEEKLADRNIAIEQSGTIAEAAFKLNGVYEAAQKAAQQYLEVIELRSRDIEQLCSEREEKSNLVAANTIARAEQQAADTLEAAKQQAQALVAEAQEKADSILAESQHKAESILRSAQDAAWKYWNKEIEKVKELSASVSNSDDWLNELGSRELR